MSELSGKISVRRVILTVLVGVLAGLSGALFLSLLHWATETRLGHPRLLWLLPGLGFVVGWLYQHWGREAVGGNNLILDEIHEPNQGIPWRMFPVVLIATILTHLGGGSAGREGTAVQMSAAAADRLLRGLRVAWRERPMFLAAALGAGFGAVLGAPWAGTLFGMEVSQVGKLRWFAFFPCLIASFVGVGVVRVLSVPESAYPAVVAVSYAGKTIFSVLLLGALCGVFARVFIFLVHRVEGVFRRGIAFPPLRPMVGGILLLLLYAWEGSYRYAGLGIETIQEALRHSLPGVLPFWKAGFTALTLGSGFKGGEFVPLVFMGSTLGSALSGWLSVGAPLLAAVGFVAMFAGAANTPLACGILAMELFGPRVGIYALLACFVSYYCSGPRGIYPSQRVSRPKHHLWIAGHTAWKNRARRGKNFCDSAGEIR